MIQAETSLLKKLRLTEPNVFTGTYGGNKAEQTESEPEILSVRDSAESSVASIYFDQPSIDQDTWIQSKSYNFGYSSPNQDLVRSETSDLNGAVQGTYTIPDVNGDPILVRYKAGPLTGFVIENMQEVQRRTSPAFLRPSKDSEDPSDQDLPALISARGSAPKPPKFVDPLHQDNLDRSYQFSYGSEEENNREETSDSKGNFEKGWGQF